MTLAICLIFIASTVAAFAYYRWNAQNKIAKPLARAELKPESTKELTPKPTPEPKPEPGSRPDREPISEPQPEPEPAPIVPPEPAPPSEPEPTPILPPSFSARDTEGRLLPNKEENPFIKALAKTRQSLASRFESLFASKTDDADQFFEQLKRTLVEADIGIGTVERVLKTVRENFPRSQDMDLKSLKKALRLELHRILDGATTPVENAASPHVTLFVGVNGVGKTTSIGKLAQIFKSSGKSVLLGAGDTYRAAAVEQLEIWAQRTGSPIVKSAPLADPASVLFDTVKKAKIENIDVVLCDTAGRLHTKTNLMDQLQKIVRVIAKATPGAPHEILLVVDATTGNNALAQAKQFSEAAPLTGVVLTKLDGTAKGGIAISVVEELKVPVRYVGIGESVGDLQPFNAGAYLDAVLAESGDA
jgi:fused signal recognition particle receptor